MAKLNRRLDRKSTRLNSSHLVISYAAPELVISSLHDALPISDGAVLLCEVATLKTMHQFEAKAGRVDTVVFSPDGRILASAGPDDAMIHLWDPITGERHGKIESAPRSEEHTSELQSPCNLVCCSRARHLVPSRRSSDLRWRGVALRGRNAQDDAPVRSQGRPSGHRCFLSGRSHPGFRRPR